MGSRSSLHEDFVRVKTLMGLEPFEVRFFVEQKFTKFDLALKWLMRNFLKLVQSLFMMFWTLWQENFLVVKSLMGTPVDWKIFTRNFFFQLRVRAHGGVKLKICLSTIKDLPIWFSGQQPLFFVPLRAPFFHRPLHCRFFRGFAPQTHLWLLQFWNSWRFMPKFPPEPAQPLFLGRFAPNFFPQRYTVVFFMTLPAPTTPQFDPLRGLAALLPQFLRSWIRFFPARCTAVFLPRTKSC